MVEEDDTIYYMTSEYGVEVEGVEILLTKWQPTWTIRERTTGCDNVYIEPKTYTWEEFDQLQEEMQVFTASRLLQETQEARRVARYVDGSTRMRHVVNYLPF